MKKFVITATAAWLVTCGVVIAFAQDKEPGALTMPVRPDTTLVVTGTQGGGEWVTEHVAMRGAITEHLAACYPASSNYLGIETEANSVLAVWVSPGPLSAQKRAQAQALLQEADKFERCEKSVADLRKLVAK